MCSNVDIILSRDVILWMYQNYPQLKYNIVENVNKIYNNVDIIQTSAKLLWIYRHNPL